MSEQRPSSTGGVETTTPLLIAASLQKRIDGNRIPRKRLAALAWSALIGLAAGTASGADNSWPMFQANAAHTGYVPTTLAPSAFTLRWTQTISADVALNPVTAAEGKVFVSEYGYFSNAGLYVLDASNGNLLWSVRYGRVYSVNPPSYAFGNVYIQTGDHSTDTYLHAHQAATGALVFRSAHSAQWERYLAPTIYDGNVYVDGGYYGGMYSFNATNGSQNWFGYVGQYDGWTPAVDANYCYVFTGSGSTTPIAGQFRIIDRFSGTTRYLVTDNAFQWSGYTMNAAVTLGAHTNAFAINEPGSVYPNYSPYGRLLMFDLRADATLTPHIGWVLKDHFTGQVTFANGVIYMINAGVLNARDELTGDLLWAWEVPGTSLTGTIIATDSHVLVGSGGAVYAVNLQTHLGDWLYPVGGHLALGEGVLYVAGANGVLTAFTAPSTPPPTNHAPVCSIGGPYTAECTGAATLVQLDGSASSDPDGDPLTFAWSSDCPGATFDNPASPTPKLTLNAFAAQSCTVTLVVSDGHLTNAARAAVVVVDSVPPVIACATNKVVECGSSWSFDPPAAADACSGTNVTVTVLGTVTNIPAGGPGLADITRTWQATDASGHSSTCSQTVTLMDTHPPDLSRLSVNPANLWPPNHKLVLVAIEGAVTDDLDPAPVCRIVAVVSSDLGPGPGTAREPDYQITGARTVLLRAERNDARVGRSYRILVEAKDASGNTATRPLSVAVPGAGK